MSTFLVVVAHELKLLRHNDFLPVLLIIPLATAVIVQLVITAGGRPDLGALAVVGPWLVGVWQLANFVAGETMNMERYRGTLEHLVAAPSSTIAVVLAKLTGVSIAGLFGLAEAVVVASLFGRSVTVHHPAVFVAAGALTIVAATATSLALVGLYVVNRSARTYQNSLSYPVLLLGGAIVPVSILPEVAQPLSRLVFLSWAGDLLRASLTSELPRGIVWSFLGLTLCTLIGGLLGAYVVRMALRRARVDGSLALV